MRVSVVVNTFNRAESLRATLDALRHQTLTAFEVIVVNGPSDDGTGELLAARAGAVRAVGCPQRNLSMSRNLGIDAAAGDVVAFIDDDAVPEPRWLQELVAAYDGPHVGGAGGLTLDNTGVKAQYRYSLCDRIGRTDFDRAPPLDAFNVAGADPFVYLQGTNCSFRRGALAAIGGFDEEIEYNYDEAEVCAQVIDSGLELRALAGAVVHHHFLPSHQRRKEGFTDPFLVVKNRTYFALRMGRDHHERAETITSLTAYMAELRAFMDQAVDRGDFTAYERDEYVARVDAGFALGLERGMAGVRRGRAIAEADPGAFLPYPVLVCEGRRLSVCFASLDYPPRPLGGVGRYTHDLARGLAQAGHEVHVVTRDDEAAHTIGYEEGVWVHRFAVSERWLPELEGHPLRGVLEHLAAVRAAVEHADARARFDVVTGSSWVAEPLLCALDGRWPVSVVCVTPMRTIAATQPATAAAPLTGPQIALEDALLTAPVSLQPISEEVAKLCRAVTAAAVEVVWLGSADHRDRHPRSPGRDHDGRLEILFSGRLEPRKGVDTLLEAAARLLRSRPAARLRLIGSDNPHANGAEGVWPAWVAEHAADVAGRIRFDGLVSDAELMQAYADCDVFCGPSRYESFGLVQVEAMMMGRPVVACNAGGMRETIVDGETGLLVAPGDADALHAALERLAGDRELRERMGAAGRARYEAEFALEVAVGRHVGRLTRLAEAGAPPAGSLPALLESLCGLSPQGAAAAAAVLLDPSRFPVDLEAGVRRALTRQPRGMIEGLFETLLGRAPGEAGLAGFLARLDAGEDPHAIVAEIATGVEARARGLDLGFLDRLPAISSKRLRQGVTAAWLHDDDAAFLAGIDALLEGLDAPVAFAGDRAAYLRARLTGGDARRAVADAGLERLDRLRTESEIAAALASAGTQDAFVDCAYRLMLGREPDPAGRAGHMRQGRAAVVRALGGSAEAAARGIPAAVTERLAAGASGSIRARLTGSLARLSGSRAVEQAVARAESRLAARIGASEARAGELAESVSAALSGSPEQRSATRAATRAAALAQRDARDARQAVDGLRAQLDVMVRKHDAMALDVREKLPASAPAAAPEPRIVDPEALAARIEAIGGLRLNIGCGEKPLPGYVNVDFRELDGVDVVADADSLPFEPGSVEEIASFHLIEHFREHHAETVLLPYWRSLLSAGGTLRVVTPNWEVLIEQLHSGRLTFRQFKTVTFGAQDYSGDDHFALYTPGTLERLLTAAGFSGVEVLADRRQNGLSPEIEVVAQVAAPTGSVARGA